MASPAPVDLAYNYIEPPECLHDKAPLIFLHGLTASKENWGDIPDIVARSTRRKTYVIDARNHGDSPWTDAFNFDYNVTDLLKLMDKVNARSAILIGHSMGGLTAYKTAVEAPERVEKIVVEDIGVNNLSDEILNMILSFLTMAQVGLQEMPPDIDEEDAKRFIIDAAYKTISLEMMEKMKITKPEPEHFHLPLKKTESGGYTFKANLAVITKALKQPQSLMSELTGDYKGPCSFIYGTASPFNVASQKEDILKFFPHAEFVPMKDATHMVHSEMHKEFVEVVLEFLLRE